MIDNRLEPLSRISGAAIHIEADNVDTDQIYPARFLSITERNGLGDYAFHGWRRDANGALLEDHPLNTAAPDARRILLVGRNFGCGSSREHAPWALYDYGVRAIIGTDIAEIFQNNCLNIGIAAINLQRSQDISLLAQPQSLLQVDLHKMTIDGPDGLELPFELDGLARQCLLSGRDKLEQLVAAKAEIEAFERRTGRSG